MGSDLYRLRFSVSMCVRFWIVRYKDVEIKALHAFGLMMVAKGGKGRTKIKKRYR